MRFYVGVTDSKWYNYLSHINPEDINFWQPGGGNFKIISPGAPFLLKLKSPYNVIAGVGFYYKHTTLPISVAWDTFGERNGCQSFEELQRMILNYRGDKTERNPTIGCIVLNAPVFFKQEDWIEAPSDWSNSIVKGKSYSTDEIIGGQIWKKVELLLEKYPIFKQTELEKGQLIIEEQESPAYGNSILTKVRIGQGAFRVGVIDAYNRRCSISGEKTLPVLEAAHIKPYAISGQNAISNGILLRSDMHKLFDMGYLTITPQYNVEVSKRIKEEFENGKEYYQHHGKGLLFLPNNEIERPHSTHLDWHNTNIFKG